jgi:hypothetical protein
MITTPRLDVGVKEEMTIQPTKEHAPPQRRTKQRRD